MTLAALAQSVGVTSVTMLQTERGQSILTDTHVALAAKALEIDPPYLLELAAIDRGKLSISDKPLRVQKLVCRIAHGELSDKVMERLAAILDREQEPIAA